MPSLASSPHTTTGVKNSSLIVRAYIFPSCSGFSWDSCYSLAFESKQTNEKQRNNVDNTLMF